MDFRRILLAIVLIWGTLTGAQAQLFDGPSHLRPSVIADTTAVVPGNPFTVGVLLTMDPGWHTYWRFPGDSGGEPKIEWQLPEGFKVGEIQWPLPRPYLDEADMLTYVYDDEVMLLVEITPPAKLEQKEVNLSATVRWLVCEQTCIPGEGPVKVTLPVGTDATPDHADAFAHWRSQLPKSGNPPFTATWDTSKKDAVTLKLTGVSADAKVQFFPLPPEGASVEHPKIGEPAADGSRTITLPYSAEESLQHPWSAVIALEAPGKAREGWTVSAAAPAQTAASATQAQEEAIVAKMEGAKQAGLLGMLGVAFLGGLILNVMPCVLPVIALKIFGFMNQAGESRDRIFKLGLAFVAGVFVFFMALAAIAIALGRSFNWGYQFQNPYILTALIALVFVFALNMLGVFEVTLGSGTTSKLSELSNKEGYTGAFLHGMFTTLLGTSCTAPFLAPSLGYATTQPPGTVILLFVAIAVGMSLPYFLLTANPSWLKYVPKPGMWMERVKQILGFVVLAVAVWLLTVLYSAHGAEAGAGATWYLLALGVAAWAVGTFAQRRGISFVLILTALAGWFVFVDKPHASEETTSSQIAQIDLENEASSGSEGARMINARISQVKPGGIPWQSWSEEAVQQGIAAGQPVFVDFTADWCINCKFFEKTVLETDDVRAALRERGVLTLKADWTKPNAEIRAALSKFGRAGVPLYVLYRPGHAEPVVMDALTKSGLLELLSSLPATPASVAAVK